MLKGAYTLGKAMIKSKGRLNPNLKAGFWWDGYVVRERYVRASEMLMTMSLQCPDHVLLWPQPPYLIYLIEKYENPDCSTDGFVCLCKWDYNTGALQINCLVVASLKWEKNSILDAEWSRFLLLLLVIACFLLLPPTDSEAYYKLCLANSLGLLLTLTFK